ncbi:DUF1499 domain-containing protein [Confluentibacter lentus]|uniref:DUF1499 domain-containing protein n=1 Tax=Confluentibacter lentus TaxID=1699412 RepID=UPI000C28ABD2|nr:DUF1499 domain-containing protein [Confluentibacter lentus]
MEESFKTYEKTIEKKHSFGWTPKFEEEFRTNLSEKTFVPIVEKTIEKLGWDLVFKDKKNIEAKRKENNFGFDKWTESITISYNHGKINVKSESLGNEIWDNGRNSKRVKLFIHVFKETENSFDKVSLEKLEIEVDKKNNWDDYIIPENLPKPILNKTPNFAIPIVGGLIISILLSSVIAILSVNGIYIIGLFEFLVALAIGFLMKYLIKISNFTEFKKLQYLLIGMIILIYVLNQYLQYEIILRENNYDRIGFFEFLKLRLEAGLTIKKLNTGWIGLVVSWGLQFVITYYVAILRLITGITSYQLERVPIEVVDFAFYNFVKNKTEDDVRKELSLKGWTDKQNQDEVFEAIGAIHGATEINRMK